MGLVQCPGKTSETMTQQQLNWKEAGQREFKQNQASAPFGRLLFKHNMYLMFVYNSTFSTF
jgi:hypothetical protein